jgi:hypothetical protein
MLMRFMMAEKTQKLFKQLGKQNILSELKGLGLKVSLSGASANSFSINPYHLGNASAFQKLAGNPQSPKGKALLVIARNKAGPTKVLATSAFKSFARKNALFALNSEKFSGILQKHGYSCRVQLPAHKMVFEKK